MTSIGAHGIHEVVVPNQLVDRSRAPEAVRLVIPCRIAGPQSPLVSLETIAQIVQEASSGATIGQVMVEGEGEIEQTLPGSGGEELVTNTEDGRLPLVDPRSKL